MSCSVVGRRSRIATGASRPQGPVLGASAARAPERPDFDLGAGVDELLRGRARRAGLRRGTGPRSGRVPPSAFAASTTAALFHVGCSGV